MFRTLQIVALAALAAVFGALASTAPAAGDKDDKGFVELFNGKDLTGWKFFSKKPEELEKTISVDKDFILVKGNPAGYFYTDKSYKNYIVRFDWRYKRPAGLEDENKFGGNSGLLVHIQKHNVWPTSLEVQGMNRDHGSFIGINTKVKDYKFDRAALDKARNKVGEWNTTEASVKDGFVTSKVNGAPIASGKVDLTEGPFGFQSEGAEIHFKNIKIKVLE
jgi:Domain of Unknown Function (DUF1080)